MSKQEKVKPELFEVQLKYWKYYVVAYDLVSAIQSLPNYEKIEEVLSVKQITGSGDSKMDILHVAKECLPQGLVIKTK
jgi:hypothetical protein